MKILIKGMVCDRCIYVLLQEFLKLDIEVTDIRLGEVTLNDNKKIPIDEKAIKEMLDNNGFELLYNKDQKTIEKIKTIVISSIQARIDTGESTKLSALISKELHRDYDSLSSLFSSLEGSTLEQFIISKKIEKIKEFLVYSDLSLSEIAYALGYSSSAYLSSQLKKHTGFTPSHYQKIRQDKIELINRSANNK
ncbi:AraC family transcriptional regulator [Myroides sp. N17-2]|uniref:AraC family transcriptional regulator n=1 Tax=Myroides sp. N17-2 TaxID=2030799 RepID=UPI000EFB3A12|nr:AraC family transcriptional regulator [Myroides sp. N17-2]